jgi:hypothetical protein
VADGQLVAGVVGYVRDAADVDGSAFASAVDTALLACQWHGSDPLGGGLAAEAGDGVAGALAELLQLVEEVFVAAGPPDEQLRARMTASYHWLLRKALTSIR